MDKDSEQDAATIARRLAAERAALETASESRRDERKPVALDQASVGRLSRMDAMQVQAMAVEAERRRRARIKAIDAALGRVEEGEFGYCAVCGEAIAVKRLDLDPCVTTCIDCARG